jgi:CRISPR system Cascade subunit CasD
VTHYTRRSELATDGLNTILSSRDYRCDAAYTVAITVADNSPHTAQQLAAALAKPVFILYLGRKSCPLAIPLNPQVVSKATLRDAFESVPPTEELSAIIPKGEAAIYWEDDAESGLDRLHVIVRRDEPRSRKRWQFSDRHENCGVMRKGE